MPIPLEELPTIITLIVACLPVATRWGFEVTTPKLVAWRWQNAIHFNGDVPFVGAALKLMPHTGLARYVEVCVFSVFGWR